MHHFIQGTSSFPLLQIKVLNIKTCLFNTEQLTKKELQDYINLGQENLDFLTKKTRSKEPYLLVKVL